MDYICRKQLNLSGKEFFPGEIIPDGTIIGSRIRTLKSSGHISEITESESVTIEGIDPMQFADSLGVVLDHTEEGLPLTTTVNAEQLQGIFDILMKNAKDAEAALKDEVDDIVLEVLKKVDSRKTVREAAEKQLTIILSIKG